MINLPYRKHYFRGVFMGIFFWVLLIPFYITNSRRRKWIYGAGSGMILFSPMINNDWYIFNRYKKTVYKAFQKFPGDSDKQLAYVAAKGGTNFFAAFLTALLVCAPLFILIYFIYLIFNN